MSFGPNWGPKTHTHTHTRLRQTGTRGEYALNKEKRTERRSNEELD